MAVNISSTISFLGAGSLVRIDWQAKLVRTINMFKTFSGWLAASIMTW